MMMIKNDFDDLNYEEKRSMLVSVLWKLKQSLGNLDTSLYIDFSLMMRDDQYRSKVLAKAIQSDIDEISELASKAQKLNIPGRLIEGHVDFEDAAHHALPPSPRHYKQNSRFLLGFSMSAFLIILFGSTVGYFVGMNKKHITPIGVIKITDNIIQDTVWKKENSYYLQKSIFVEGNAKLTIEAGTKVYGMPNSALIVTREASIYARGKQDAPIIFTSSAAEGKRQSGDWGGIVLLGDAPTNRSNPHIEGIDENDTRGHFGGRNESANCGLLEYVRIEFAGYEVYANNELNGLTLGGCGSNTIIRNIQVHMALDDGIEVFGGNVNLDHIVITGADDDSFDWDMGWRGGVQFLVIKQYPGRGDNGFEADNDKKSNDIQPRSEPTFINVTMVGTEHSDKKQRGMTIRRGSGGHFKNFIVTGFTGELIDIRDKATVELIKKGQLTLDNILVYAVGPAGMYYPIEVGDKDDDAGFDEKKFLDEAKHKIVHVNPQLASPFDMKNLQFSPQVDSPAGQYSSAIPEGEFWDEGATFLGAIRPGVKKTWLNGWTNYSEN